MALTFVSVCDAQAANLLFCL